MNSKTTHPPEPLLDSVEEIANIKQSLSLRDRLLTSANGFYVQSGSLPGFEMQYMAGGEFVAKLIFVKKSDGSREVTKYRPGTGKTKRMKPWNFAVL